MCRKNVANEDVANEDVRCEIADSILMTVLIHAEGILESRSWIHLNMFKRRAKMQSTPPSDEDQHRRLEKVSLSSIHPQGNYSARDEHVGFAENPRFASAGGVPADCSCATRKPGV
jgi:hypothetical protein